MCACTRIPGLHIRVLACAEAKVSTRYHSSAPPTPETGPLTNLELARYLGPVSLRTAEILLCPPPQAWDHKSKSASFVSVFWG